MWEEATKRLAHEFLCLAPDLRGFGKAKEESKSFSMKDLARDCHDLLVAKNIRKPIIVCGLSMGGYVAMQFADDFPNLVSHLVLTNTRANADDDAGVQNRLHMAQKALTQGTKSAVGEMLKKMVCTFTEERNPALCDSVGHMAYSTHPSTIAWAQLGMCKRPSFFEKMERWRFPTLCLAGSADTVTPPSVVERIHQSIPRSRYVVVANSAHLTPMEQPDIFASQLRSFVTEQLH